MSAVLKPIFATAVAVLVATGCEQGNEPHETKVIVLGFDGMDAGLCREMIDAGLLPNLAKLAEQGSFSPLGTSTPPQSPVAWSNLMTGTDSGRHGVFDFVHRDPVTSIPFSSAAMDEPPKPLLLLGHSLDEVSALGYKLPLRPNLVKANRHAPAIWEYLTAAGKPVHIFRMPANYPPAESSGAHFCCLSDMGTPDLTNSLGTFSYYTTDPAEHDMKMADGGGELYPVSVSNHKVESEFVGPTNDFLVPKTGLAARLDPGVKHAVVPFAVLRDPTEAVATIRYSGKDVVLEQGEWSDWQTIEFEMIPHLVTLKGMCRFLLKEVHPHVKLYVSPFNFDPQEKSWEIDQPADWSVTVSDAVGRYYTQGLPEDTKALSNEVLSRDEFLQQAELIFEERTKLLEFALDHYRGGLLFFYFGSTDQIAHMFWGARKPGHPAITPEEHIKYKRVMEDLYVRMDEIVGRTAKRFADATLMVMSDHGFDDYKRSFSLNTWLKENGYAAMKNPFNHDESFNFDFSATRAYGLGINALYINLRGRESGGIVDPFDKQSLMDEIAAKLKAYRDPKTGGEVVKEVYQCDKIFSGPMVAVGPDMIIGYARGYQGGGSALGSFPKEVVKDNTDAWCGDHCVATDLVPGVLFTNRKTEVHDPTLLDIAPTILQEFGLTPPEVMKGRNLFARSIAMASNGQGVN